MDENELLDERRQALRESIAYFSNANKQDRERWVCRLLLNSLKVSFQEAEVRSSLTDPPDVFFRDAEFEIKEIQEPDRERHREYKRALARAVAATELQELTETFSPRAINPEGIADHVLAKLTELANKYPPAIRNRTDLLLYVNLQDTFFEQGPVPGPELFASFGWRSVSAAENQVAIVFFAGPAAPVFLRDVQGSIQQDSKDMGLARGSVKLEEVLCYVG